MRGQQVSSTPAPTTELRLRPHAPEGVTGGGDYVAYCLLWRIKRRVPLIRTPLTRRVVTAATAVSGVVAGTSIDTAIVKLPTWRRLGPEPWADYTRRELSTSLVWYPVLGIGGVALNLWAAVAVQRDTDAGRAVLPSRAVAVLALGHLLTTAKAAPRMVQVKDTDDPDALQRALDSFGWWHLARTVVDASTFAANLRSLMSLSKS